jgi:hypothetical protein
MSSIERSEECFHVATSGSGRRQARRRLDVADGTIKDGSGGKPPEAAGWRLLLSQDLLQ